MSQTFHITISGVSMDDYVANVNDIPTCDRNRDFTLVASEFDLYLSPNISSPSDGDYVFVFEYGSSYPFFVGFVDGAPVYNYSTDLRKVHISSALKKMTEKSLTRANVHSLLTSTNKDKYNSSDSEGYPNVQVIYLLKQLFNDATGYSLRTSGIEDVILETKEPTAGEGNQDLKIKHLCYDENMLYCLNNSIAASGTAFIIESNKNYANNIFSYLDFLSLFCSSIGLVAYWSQTGSVRELVLDLKNDTTYSFTNDEMYEKVENNKLKNEGGYSYIIRYSANRSDYAGVLLDISGDSYIKDEVSEGDGKNGIDVPANLIFPYRDLRQPAGTGYIYPIANNSNFKTVYIPRTGAALSNYGMLHEKIRTVNSDFSTLKIVSPYKLIYRANYNRINIEDETSEYYHEVES